MKFFKKLLAKHHFTDGSVLLPSGKEQFSFVDSNGKRYEFDVLHTSSSANAEKLLVSASMIAIDGAPIPDAVKQEIVSKSTRYFAERGYAMTLI